MILETLNQQQQEKILAYLDLVIEKNKELNLTRIDTKDEGILLHIEDSLSCLEEFNNKKGEFLDIGTGGGFPGVPLAIASGRSGLLIDSVQKKARAVDEIIHSLNLSRQIQTMGIRSEDLARNTDRRFETIVARAVSSLPVVLELACPLLAESGELIALRGRENDEDIQQAAGIAKELGLELTKDRSFKLDNTYDRRVLVYRRVGETQIDLPRRNGMAQKKPLKI